MTDAERIASTLSEAQRSFLLWLPCNGEWRNTTERELNRWGSNALRGFGQSGLIDGYYREVMRHRLTPLGLEVRALLQEKTGG